MARAAQPEKAERPTISAESSSRSRNWAALGVVSGCVAIAAALLLPLAPIDMNQPVVSWPLDSDAPQSSMLELTAQQPIGLEVRFSCTAVMLAAETQDRIVVATIRPGQPSLEDVGLVVQASGNRGNRVTASVSGREVIDDELGSEDCRYLMTIQQGLLTVTKDEDDAELIESVTLPQVDVLATSLTSIPGGDTDDLSVNLTVDDQFSTTPSPLKLGLTVLLIFAAGLTLFLLVLRDRAAIKTTQPVRHASADSTHLHYVLRVVQLLVPAVLVLWLFIAPMTDDDGYYAAMARNSPLEGYVGNYYQLLNQSFTPFTWFYRVLGYWDSLVGSSQVLLRIPALLAGLLTWLLLQRFVSRTQLVASSFRSNKYGDVIVSVTLAVTFLAWWLPYNMGVRPEGIVALLSAGVLIVVQSAIRTKRLAFMALGLLLAGLSIVCHPTGFIALAPLVAGLPSMWPFIRGEDRRGTAHNILAVIAPAGLISAVAFGDGSLRDFIHGQEIFLSRFAQSTWYEEYNRYGLLLNAIPMGSYAKRAAVLLGLICLLWFAVLVAAGRGRGLRLNSAFLLTGYSLALALIFLWLTPSKWTHHFGSLAALGPAFLTMFLLSAPAIAARFTGLKRIARPFSLAIAFSAIVVFVLSFRGPNSWAYSWKLGMTHADLPPGLGPLTFASVPAWVAGYGLLVAGLAWWARRRNLSWRPMSSLITASTMAVLFLMLSTGYLIASFGLAAVRTWDTYSPMAANLQDPLATGCDAAGAIDVLADSTAQPLPRAPQGSSPNQEDTGSTFIEQGGFFSAAPPPGGVGSPAASLVWGSLAGPPEEEEATGVYTSPWFVLPSNLGSEEAVGILAAGRLDGGNGLVVEYARLVSGRPYVVDSQELTDSIDSPVWRSIPLDVEDHVGADDKVLRVVATDATADTGGWLAFTSPSVQTEISLQDYIPMDAAVGVSWQFSFLFPCQRLPTVQNGITEPIEFGVVYGTEGINGLDDNTWTIYAGGLFGPVSRVAGIAQLPAQLRGAPDIPTLQIYRFDNPYPGRAYELHVRTRTLLGWQMPSW